jgi:redox-sensing transcriptional repressor
MGGMDSVQAADVSEKTIGRLSAYRRLLYRSSLATQANVYSYQIAAVSGATPAQVRRDLMAVGYSGSPNKGYRVQDLVASIGEFLDNPEGENVCLIGVGNLGRAILSFFSGRRPKLAIVAAFDIAFGKVNRTVHGCRCYPLEDLPVIVKRENIHVGIISAPADAAQSVADMLVEAGVCGMLNFAPIALRVPAGVYSEDIDMTVSLEKVAYFARKMRKD